MDQKQRGIAAACRLLLCDLTPNELCEVLLEAGVFAPAVSSVEYMRDRLSKRGLDISCHAVALEQLRLKVPQMVAAMIDDGYFKGTIENLHEVRERRRRGSKP